MTQLQWHLSALEKQVQSELVSDPDLDRSEFFLDRCEGNRDSTSDLDPEPVSSSPDSFHKVHTEVPDSGQWLYSIICDSKCISNIGAFINRL